MTGQPNHKFLFVGDVVLDSTPEFTDSLNELIASSVVCGCNFEAPLTGFGKAINKTGPVISQIQKAPKILEDLGFNLFSLANNHICDYSDQGLIETINAFKKGEVIGVGNPQAAYGLTIREIDGVIYGFVAYGENGFGALNGDRELGHAWINHPRVNDDIQLYKEQVDVLVVQIHAGVEMLDVPIPEWRVRFREIIDLGADVIVAHHPHVIQGTEEYRGKLICYSLGNFYFDYPTHAPLWNMGAMLELNFRHKQLFSYKVHVLEKKDVSVDLKDDDYSQKLISQLNSKLNAENYEDYVNQKALDDWQKHHASYYAKPFNGLAGYGLVKLLKHIKRVIFNRTIDYQMLWHNQFIESNKWLVERAIRYKLKQK